MDAGNSEELSMWSVKMKILKMQKKRTMLRLKKSIKLKMCRAMTKMQMLPFGFIGQHSQYLRSHEA